MTIDITQKKCHIHVKEGKYVKKSIPWTWFTIDCESDSVLLLWLATGRHRAFDSQKLALGNPCNFFGSNFLGCRLYLVYCQQ